MKILKIVCGFGILWLLSMTLMGQTTISIERPLSTAKASSSKHKNEHGIVLGNVAGKQFTITLKAETEDNIQFGWLYFCIFSPINFRTHNSKLVMYETQATHNSPSNSEGYIHDYQFNASYSNGNPYYFYRGFIAGDQICRSNAIKPDQRKFFKNQAFTTRWNIPWVKWLDNTVDVKITLTFTGDLELTDFEKIVIPGVGTLYWDDFIDKTAYNQDHGCDGASDQLCDRIANVREPNVNGTTDVIVQAHRGVWGKPGTNQENTLGAMQAAVADGYYLLESDIMPVNVHDGGAYVDAGSGLPSDLACFHDFILTRYTSETNNANRVYNRSRTQLKALSLKEPRSETNGSEKILMFDELVDYAVSTNSIVCVDMKNLESKGADPNCTELCDWQDQSRKNESLYHNLKYALNNTTEARLKHIAVKTYAAYDDLKTNLTTGSNAVSESRFNKVLWAPMLAPAPQWRINPADSDSDFDPDKIKAHLNGWFVHNESVLYYETNFFNDFDDKSSVMLDNSYCKISSSGQQCYNIMEYIYEMSGRRAGIFSEEPVGGKGTVNRWGKWKIKNPVSDRRGDHLWLLSQPYFKYAVITTDRPDLWDQLNGN